MKTETVSLTTADGHKLEAYVAHPEGNATELKGGIIVIQEIFGLTGHIRKMTEEFAEAGYLAIAPAMFDRIAKNRVLDYSEMDAARECMGQLDLDQCVLDIKAAAGFADQAGKLASSASAGVALWLIWRPATTWLTRA